MNSPWKPGQSGNPGGRPKGFGAYIREKTEDGKEIVDFFLKVFRGEDIDRRRPKLKDRVDAGSWLTDRGYGRPAQAVELSGPDGEPIKTDLSNLSTEDLIVLRELAAKLQQRD